jgi:hypothetical protein
MDHLKFRLRLKDIPIGADRLYFGVTLQVLVFKVNSQAKQSRPCNFYSNPYGGTEMLNFEDVEERDGLSHRYLA